MAKFLGSGIRKNSFISKGIIDQTFRKHISQSRISSQILVEERATPLFSYRRAGRCFLFVRFHLVSWQIPFLHFRIPAYGKPSRRSLRSLRNLGNTKTRTSSKEESPPENPISSISPQGLQDHHSPEQSRELTRI